MFVGELETTNPSVKLVKPDVGRDPLLSVQWLSGPVGRETLRLMGVPDKDNHEPTLESERETIGGFLTDNGEIDWMIEFDGHVVGAIWVHIHRTYDTNPPAVSMMIGDLAARGQGVGRAAFAAVLAWLRDERHETAVYARHLVDNAASKTLLDKFGFINDGDPYIDTDNLRWQNVRLDFESVAR